MLGLLSFISAITSIIFEFKTSLFKSKIIFMMDVISQICIAMYNFNLWVENYWVSD
jgi:hypothetical protein